VLRRAAARLASAREELGEWCPVGAAAGGRGSVRGSGDELVGSAAQLLGAWGSPQFAAVLRRHGTRVLPDNTAAAAAGGGEGSVADDGDDGDGKDDGDDDDDGDGDDTDDGGAAATGAQLLRAVCAGWAEMEDAIAQLLHWFLRAMVSWESASAGVSAGARPVVPAGHTGLGSSSHSWRHPMPPSPSLEWAWRLQPQLELRGSEGGGPQRRPPRPWPCHPREGLSATATTVATTTGHPSHSVTTVGGQQGTGQQPTEAAAVAVTSWSLRPCLRGADRRHHAGAAAASGPRQQHPGGSLLIGGASNGRGSGMTRADGSSTTLLLLAASDVLAAKAALGSAWSEAEWLELQLLLRSLANTATPPEDGAAQASRLLAAVWALLHTERTAEEEGETGPTVMSADGGGGGRDATPAVAASALMAGGSAQLRRRLRAHDVTSAEGLRGVGAMRVMMMRGRGRAPGQPPEPAAAAAEEEVDDASIIALEAAAAAADLADTVVAEGRISRGAARVLAALRRWAMAALALARAAAAATSSPSGPSSGLSPPCGVRWPVLWRGAAWEGVTLVPRGQARRTPPAPPPRGGDTAAAAKAAAAAVIAPFGADGVLVRAEWWDTALQELDRRQARAAAAINSVAEEARPMSATTLRQRARQAALRAEMAALSEELANL
jgi:hypothetical protein